MASLAAENNTHLLYIRSLATASGSAAQVLTRLQSKRGLGLQCNLSLDVFFCTLPGGRTQLLLITRLRPSSPKGCPLFPACDLTHKCQLASQRQ